MIGSILAALAMQPASPIPSECVYHAVPIERRVAIGQMVMARETDDVAAATLAATDRCAGQHRWTAEQALNANGYAIMRMAAEAIAYQLGHNEWADQGLAAVDALTGEQRAALVGPALTGTTRYSGPSSPTWRGPVPGWRRCCCEPTIRRDFAVLS